MGRGTGGYGIFCGRLIQLLASVNIITVTLSLGVELDDQDRPSWR